MPAKSASKKNRVSGFEGLCSLDDALAITVLADSSKTDGFADPPLTPDEHAVEQMLYDP